jgi:RNA polymerase sigma factor (sigma-70 family)
MDDSQKLLADYVKNGSESAFRELVARYINLVHSTALRLVQGDAHMAEDITQTVFVDLARKAHTFPPEVMLGGWLHRDACFVAGTTMRGERRRHFRERQAVAMNDPVDHTAANLALVAPILDEAINQLEPDDRAAILLRFFEQLEFRAVGERTGSNEDAARMRVTRALDKLHVLLKNRGVVLSAATLGAALAAEAVTAAPPGLAAAIAATALGSVAAGSTTATLLKFMTMTKFKIGIVSAMAVAALAAPVVMQHQSIAKLRGENRALQEQTAQLASLQAENERLSNLVVQAGTAPAPAEKQVRELARLRDEVGRLRQQTNEMAKTLTNARHANSGAAFGSGSGKRNFRTITMAEFAKFIGGVLETPVADQTGLTGTYDIAMTPPRIGGNEGKLERVTGILHDELGLQLTPFDGPFTAEEEDFEHETLVRQVLPDGTITNVMTNLASSAIAAHKGFAIKLDHSDAPGLKASTGEADVPEVQMAGYQVFFSDSPAAPSEVVNNLRLIEGAKTQWALEFKKQNTDTPTWEDIRPYLVPGPNGDITYLTKPVGGEYVIRSVGEKPQFHSRATASVSFEQLITPADPSIVKQNACINNLRLIDAAKQQWALEFKKHLSETPTQEDLQPYLGRGGNGEFPVCPDGGVYTIKSVGEAPTCSVSGHALP